MGDDLAAVCGDRTQALAGENVVGSNTVFEPGGSRLPVYPFTYRSTASGFRTPSLTTGYFAGTR